MTRRELLLRTGQGFGALALSDLLAAEAVNPLAPKAPHESPRAERVIFLFMHGGVSHVDTFDPKPELQKRSGQPLSVEMAKTIKTSFIHDPTKAVLRGSPWEFKPGGKSGPTTSASSAPATLTFSITLRPSTSRPPAPSSPANRAWAPGSLTASGRSIRTCRPSL